MLNFDDPKTLALIQMGLGLLGGAPGKNKNFGADLGHAGLLGLQGYQQGKQFNARQQEEEQQRAMRQMQMDALNRQQSDQDAVRGAFTRNVTPGAPQMLPSDYETPSGPAGPSSLNMGGLQRDLMALGPAGMPHLSSLAAMQAKNYQKLGKGESLYDMSSPGKPIASGAPDLPPGMVMGANGPEYMPGYLSGQKDIKAAGRPVVNATSHMPPQEKQEAKDYGALLVSNFKGLQEAAAAARRENATLSGLEKIPLETTALTPANVTVSSWIAALGGGDRFKDVASQGQGFTGFAKELVLARQQAQKGPQTEADARRLEQSTAQLGNTSEANKLLIGFNKAVNKRIIEQERFFSDWRAKKGTLDGAERAWFEGKGGTSVWDEPELKKFQSLGGAVTLRFDKNGNPI